MFMFSCSHLPNIAFVLWISLVPAGSKHCSDLLMGQYRCDTPRIDPETQSEVGCTSKKVMNVSCYPAKGIVCDNTTFDGEEVGLQKSIPCTYTNGTSWEIALLLSVFLGMFGIDRFYLGYPAIGLLKLSTLGFGFLGQLVDIILIASQVVVPADGSDYIINYFGPRLFRIEADVDTYLKPQTYS